MRQWTGPQVAVGGDGEARVEEGDGPDAAELGGAFGLIRAVAFEVVQECECGGKVREGHGLADRPRRALLLCAAPASTYDSTHIFAVVRAVDALHRISPTSSPQIAPSLSVSLNLVDFRHLVHKISAIAGQRLTTTALAPVRFPAGVEKSPGQTGRSRSQST